MYERSRGKLVPRDQRIRTGRRRKKSIQKVCEYIHCRKESGNGKWYKSTTTNLTLCSTCERYERRNGTLKRKFGQRQPNQEHSPTNPEIKSEDVGFLTSTKVCPERVVIANTGFNGQVALEAGSEQFRNTHQVTIKEEDRGEDSDEKNSKQKVCEYIHCRKESSTGKWYQSKTVANLIICSACNEYERNGTLKRKAGQRKPKPKHPSNSKPCEFCNEAIARYRSKTTQPSLKICSSCRQWEIREKKLVPRAERKGKMLKEIESQDVGLIKCEDMGFLTSMEAYAKDNPEHPVLANTILNDHVSLEAGSDPGRKICQLCNQQCDNTYLYKSSGVPLSLSESCYQDRYQMTRQLSTAKTTKKRKRSANNTTTSDLNKRSKFKGVTWDGRTRRWLCRVKWGNGLKYVGYFSTEMEAAQAHDAKARNLYADDISAIKLNFGDNGIHNDSLQAVANPEDSDDKSYETNPRKKKKKKQKNAGSTND
jgi:hypothetical protein